MDRQRKHSIGRRIVIVIGGLIATLAFAPAVHAAGFKVYVSNEKDNSISVIDSESLTVIDTFRVGQRPRRHYAHQGWTFASGLRQRRRHGSGGRSAK